MADGYAKLGSRPTRCRQCPADSSRVLRIGAVRRRVPAPGEAAEGVAHAILRAEEVVGCGSWSRAAAARAASASCATCASTAMTCSTSTPATTAARTGSALVADLTDLGQTLDALAGADAVVHFAAIPAPETSGRTARRSGSTRCRPTTSSRRPRRTGCDASSGRRARPSSACRSTRRRPFAPIDETIEPRPESSYSLSKLVGETMAAQFARRTGIGFVGLRISNIMDPRTTTRFPTYWDDARLRKWNLWGYVDARDVATAARLGLEADIDGLGDLHRGRGGHGHDPAQRRPDGRGLPGRAAAPRRSRVARRSSRSTTRASCSATSRPIAGRTTSAP